MSQRDALAAFIRAAQAAVGAPDGMLHGLYTRIDKPGGEPWEGETLTLQFGRGYFQPDLVLVVVGDDIIGEAEVDEAVNAYVEARVPRVKRRADGE